MATGDGGSSGAPPLDCLVVGAGISGLLAGWTLRAAGHGVLVVDKGRGVGGRMATRRLGARASIMARSSSPGAAATSGDTGHIRYRGLPAMTAVPKLLAADQQVRTGARIASLATTHDGWTARIEGREPIVARAVVVSAPVPQALALLEAGAASLPAALRAELDLVAYAPCIAVMARLSRPSGLAPPGALALEAGPLRSIADNQIKGVSDLPALTLHAATSVSCEWLAAPDEAIAALLLDAAAQYAALAVEEVQVHRWRYAEPTRGPSARCLFAREPRPIVFCGDAFGGPRVEGAALSGLAAGRRAVELLGEL